MAWRVQTPPVRTMCQKEAACAVRCGLVVFGGWAPAGGTEAREGGGAAAAGGGGPAARRHRADPRRHATAVAAWRARAGVALPRSPPPTRRRFWSDAVVSCRPTSRTTPPLRTCKRSPCLRQHGPKGAGGPASASQRAPCAARGCSKRACGGCVRRCRPHGRDGGHGVELTTPRASHDAGRARTPPGGFTAASEHLRGGARARARDAAACGPCPPRNCGFSISTESSGASQCLHGRACAPLRPAAQCAGRIPLVCGGVRARPPLCAHAPRPRLRPRIPPPPNRFRARNATPDDA